MRSRKIRAPISPTVSCEPIKLEDGDALVMPADQVPRWARMLARDSFDRDYYRAMVALLDKPPELIFDFGANVGMTVLHFARLAKRVVAIEPNPYLTDFFKENMRLNGIGNVTLCKTAVADFVGTTNFQFHQSTAQCHLTARRSHTQVPVTTLDLLSQKFGYPEFMKIDIEGSGYRLLNGGEKTLERVQVLHIELNGCRDPFTGKDTNWDAWRLLKAAGFRRVRGRITDKKGNFVFKKVK